MVYSFRQCEWFVSNLDVPSDIKFIILMKTRKAFEQEMKDKQSTLFDGKSLCAIKRRAKRIGCCYRCARLNCNSVIRENGKKCNGLFFELSWRIRKNIIGSGTAE